jgi:hypothetical protein
MAVPQPCGDKCQNSCLFASPQKCTVPIPPLSRSSSNSENDNNSNNNEKEKKFAGAQCYQKCLWGCVRGCFAKLSPAAARAEAEHWNATASELESWHQEAKNEVLRLQTKVSDSTETPESDSNSNKNGKSLEDRVEKVRKIADYVEVLKVAANKEKKTSEALANIGNKAEEAVGI